MSRGLVFALLVMGCGGPLDERATTPDAAVDGGACSGWTVLGVDGCAPRQWRLPTAASALFGPQASSPEVAVDVDGLGTLVWGATLQDDTLWSAREDADGDWQLAPVATPEGSALEPALIGSASGEILVAWKEVIAGTGRIRAFASASGSTWRPIGASDGAVSPPQNSYQPRFATSPAGDVLVWNQGVEHGYSVAVATRPPHGEWRLPREADVLAPPVLYSNSPEVAMNAHGDAVVGWFQSLGDVLRVLVSERRGADEPFSEARESDVLSPPHTLAQYPMPTVHDSGAAAVGWIQETPNHDWVFMLATRTPAGAWTRPTDVTEAMARGLPATGKPLATFTADGALHLIWTEGDEARQRLWWRQRTPDGRWDSQPVALSPAEGFAIEPVVTAAKSGLVLAWRTRREGRFIAYVRTLALGAVRWDGAVAVSAALADDASQPEVAVGGPNDRVIVAWRQGRANLGRIYVAILP